MVWPPETATDHTSSKRTSTNLMKPVSEVITSPGTTRSFRSKAETDRDTGFRTVGNLMSAAMLLLPSSSASLSGSWKTAVCVLPPPTEV